VNTTIVAKMPIAKAIVTTSPDVVRESSFFMQTSAPDVDVKQRFPAAQVAISVVVETQVVDVPVTV